MKPLLLPLLFGLALWGLTGPAGYGQSADIDRLKRQLAGQPNDTTRVRLLNRLAMLYFHSKPDTTYRLAQQAHQLARQLADQSGQALSLNRMGVALNYLGDYPKALRLFQQSLLISRTIDDFMTTARTLNNTADIYYVQKDYQRALSLYLVSLAAMRQASRRSGSSYDLDHGFITTYSNVGGTYWRLNRLDSAEYYGQLALQLSRQLAGRYKDKPVLYSVPDVLGHIREKRGNYRAALRYYQQSLAITRQTAELSGQADVYLSIAELYQKTGPADSARSNARRALTTSQQSGYLPGILKASQLLTQLYEGQDNTQALAYYKVMVAAQDSLFSQEKVRQLLTLDFEEQQRQQELAATQEAYQNRLRTYGLSGLVAVVLLIVGLMWRTNRRQKTTNQLLHQQKEELDRQRGKAQQALTELQAAQTRLVHQEKMASLGELTAGIAHEIQNPLNFVNNFAEVSTELVDELRAGPLGHLTPAQQDEADELLTDLTQNLAKITTHGQRASSIVKGMLAHSRTGMGEKRPTDLNALAREYLQIAYQGVRAKDKTFNAELITDFGPGVSKVELVPQELGRVLLNLFNNAFYAVRQRQQSLSAVAAGPGEGEPENYQPTVTVRTRRLKGQVELTVEDNGTGMTDAVQQKIFQPFFTTKPTGEGTGLGLSLSYDIITKGHGGTLSVDSQIDQYTRISLQLPG